MRTPERDLLRHTVQAIKPVLNRVVFSGVPICRGWFDSTSPRARISDLLPIRIDLHATAPLERLGTEVAAAGVQRQSYRDGSEAWIADPRVSLRVWGPVDGSATGDAVVRDYAVLLTRSETIEQGTAIRVTTLPVQIALWCAAHRATAPAALDSPWIEDVVTAILARREIVTELRALPGEVRAVVADVVSEFLAASACRWILGRMIVEARSTPSLVGVVINRLESVAALPRS